MAGHGGPLSWDGSEAKQLWQGAKLDRLKLDPPMAGHGWPLSWAGLEAKQLGQGAKVDHLKLDTPITIHAHSSKASSHCATTESVSQVMLLIIKRRGGSLRREPIAYH